MPVVTVVLINEAFMVFQVSRLLTRADEEGTEGAYSSRFGGGKYAGVNTSHDDQK